LKELIPVVLSGREVKIRIVGHLYQFCNTRKSKRFTSICSLIWYCTSTPVWLLPYCRLVA